LHARKHPSLAIISNSVVSKMSMSGGDRIFIELAREWQSLSYSVSILVCQEAVAMFSNLKGVRLVSLSHASVERFGVLLGYAMRIVQSLMRVVLNPRFGQFTLVCSSSDFLTDVLPGFALSSLGGGHWVAGLFLIAPNPFRGETSLTIRSLFYYVGQKVSIFLMKCGRARVLVLNEFDKATLCQQNGVASERVKVISGAVDLVEVQGVRPQEGLSFEGCFVGRFHSQKGIDDLLNIWSRVCSTTPRSKLAIIGWGDDTSQQYVMARIEELGLSQNVRIFGFLDGKRKYAVMKSCRVLLFPSSRESWGLVVLEALACGLPVVAYDLPVLRSAFGDAIVTVPMRDREAFARAVLRLLEDEYTRSLFVSKGTQLSQTFSWKRIAQSTLEGIE